MSKIEVSRQQSQVGFLVCIGLLSAAGPAIAHHALDGKIPSNFFEGFVSGLAHPIIGLDHFAFIVAIGLLAVGLSRGALIPAGFILTALVGTGIHLLKLDLPGAEMIIAGSAIAFGVMLFTQQRPNFMALTALASGAGLFHGYAYGESIVGAQMTPLLAYLLGFSLIQYAISLLALLIGNWTMKKFTRPTFSPLQFAGFVICSIGTVFLTSSLLG
ncbi:HupE/UreJ family protein [Microseira sp. BLCC-F43]|uniref:HupE/UreJ family protein n=1 Tax=Microseira sp. BLCC-F43 TaxID=3153602 RepID=UPI0035B6AF26